MYKINKFITSWILWRWILFNYEREILYRLKVSRGKFILKGGFKNEVF